MTEATVIAFPGSIAVIAALVLVLSAYTALAFWLVNAVADRFARRPR